MRNPIYFIPALMICVFSQISAFGQLTPDPETKKFTFQETVPMDSLTKDQIFERAENWMTNYFKTNKFDVNDKTNAKISQEGNFQIIYTYDFKYKSDNTVLYTFTLDYKAGKYRYTVTDFKIYDNKIGPKAVQSLEVSYAKMKSETKKDFGNKLTAEVNKLAADLKTAISATPSNEGDDW